MIEARDDLEPGDIVLVNDPYFGGTHLMDVKMVRPFFYKGRLWAYLSNTGHWPDTGGMVPGGFPFPGNRDPAGGAQAATGQAAPARRARR